MMANIAITMNTIMLSARKTVPAFQIQSDKGNSSPPCLRTVKFRSLPDRSAVNQPVCSLRSTSELPKLSPAAFERSNVYPQRRQSMRSSEAPPLGFLQLMYISASHRGHLPDIIFYKSTSCSLLSGSFGLWFDSYIDNFFIVVDRSSAECMFTQR